MRCLYCERVISPYPADKTCPNCGALLPPDTEPAWKPVQTPPVQPPPPAYAPPQLRCPHCGSTQITCRKRGFRWGLAILGFVLLSPLGLLFGLIGSKRMIYTCRACGSRTKSAL